jgi:hypothetical protein
MPKDESEKLNIYPPEFPDPLKPTPAQGSEAASAAQDSVALGEKLDQFLGATALENMAGEAPPLTPEEARAIVDAAAGGPPLPDLPPDDMLREIFKGQMNPALPVAGARVEYCARIGNWRDAVALRVADVDQADGNVLLDLEWGDRNAVTAVRYGEGVRCWRFRAE